MDGREFASSTRVWSRTIALTQSPSRSTESNPARQSEVTEDLFVAYSQRIYAYCLRTLGSPEEAEDALQDTYCNAWGSLRRGCEPRDPRAWLFSIAHNACGTLLRTRARNAREQARPGDEIDQAFGRADPDRDRLIGLRRAIDSLPEKQKRALLLREWRGLSYDEVASELDVSVAATETLIFRARNSVAAALDRAGRPSWRTGLPSLAVAPLAFGDWTKEAMKSLFASQVGTTKWALRFALVATAPLMIFGLAQGPLERVPERQRLEAAPTAPPSSLSVALPDAPGGATTPVRPEPKGVPQRGDAAADAGVAGVTAEGAQVPPIPKPDPEPVAPPTTPGPSPPPITEEPPSGHSAAVKVTICHETGGDKTVTISVAEPALAAHLAHGDLQGACS